MSLSRRLVVAVDRDYRADAVLEAPVFEVAFRDDCELAKRFRDLARQFYTRMLAQRERDAAADRAQRKRFSVKAAWEEIKKDPVASKKLQMVCLQKGHAGGDAFVRKWWNDKYPKRPAHRPPGDITPSQLRAYANTAALNFLLDFHRFVCVQDRAQSRRAWDKVRNAQRAA